MLATAFFDGTVGIYSIQSTNEIPGGPKDATSRPDGADIFDAPGLSSSSLSGTLSLKQPPKWLRRPVSSSFGFGGKLVTASNLASSQGKPQSSVVHIRKVVTETELVERAKRLQAAIDENSLQTFAEERTEGEGWKGLLSLFKADSRDELVTLLGFSKSEIASRVAEAVENLKVSAEAKSAFEDQDTVYKPHEYVVSFAEPEREGDEDEPAAVSEERTPSEVSASVTSDTASAVLPTDGESATTAPSLFGDDIPGTPQVDAHDFFNTVGVAQDDGESHPVHVPHTNYGLDSSVAATIGSGPSSVTSETTKFNGFRIYPSEESDVDRLVTKALVLGDFDSAVALCLSSGRFADAILLAVRGGPELLQRTQKAYFERRTTSLPSLRLFQSIVINDLSDIVQNADLRDWREIFVVLCTFASQDEFSTLTEQLGKRLEDESTLAQGSDEQAELYRENATLTYLAAARLERLVSIWADELVEEEKARVSNEKYKNGSSYSAHAHALQTFVEKVTVFRAATSYKDQALVQTSTNGNELPQTFKLAILYDRYFEYADLLCTQGLVKDAVRFLQLTPSGYKGSAPGSDFSAKRKRLIDITTTPPNLASASTAVKTSSTIPAASAPAAATVTSTARPTGYGYTGYPAPAQPTAPRQQQPPAKYGLYEAPSISAINPYSQPQQVQQSQQQPHYSQTNTSTYASLTQPPHLRQHQQPLVPSHLAPPPRAASGPPPPPPKRDGGGWNDVPVSLPPPSRVPAALPLNKPAAITSPFPNAAPSPGYSPQPSPYSGQSTATLPPPPRPGSVTRGQVPPQRPISSQPPPGPPGPHGPPGPPGPPGGPGGPPRAASRSSAAPPVRVPPAPPKYRKL
jgi:protein transport protein SEC31